MQKPLNTLLFKVLYYIERRRKVHKKVFQYGINNIMLHRYIYEIYSANKKNVKL